MAYTSFPAESPLWELHGREAGCPSATIWPYPKRAQEPPEEREELPCFFQCRSAIAGPLTHVLITSGERESWGQFQRSHRVGI